MYECQQQAAAASNNNQFAGGNVRLAWVLIGAIASANKETSLYEECLKAHGLLTEEIMLGLKYGLGQETEPDYRKAMENYKIASEQGYGLASYNIGVLYDNGQGVPADHEKAKEWYLKAASQGYVPDTCKQLEKQLIGTWKVETENRITIVNYKSNHTFTGLEKDDLNGVSLSLTVSGEWEVDGKMLKATLTKGTCDHPELLLAGTQYAGTQYVEESKRSPAPHLRPFGPSRIAQVCFEVPNERI